MMWSIKIIQTKIVIESTKMSSETNEFHHSEMMAGYYCTSLCLETSAVGAFLKTEYLVFFIEVILKYTH